MLLFELHNPVLQGSVRTSRKVDFHVCDELYMFASLVQVLRVGIHYNRTSTSTAATASIVGKL